MSGSAEGLRYKRLMLKLSGEALLGKGAYGIDMGVVTRLAGEIKTAMEAGAGIGVVVGGGNIFRGLAGAAKGMDRATADYMGMLATVMNALAFQNGLEQAGVQARVLSAIPMPTVCEAFVHSKAMHHLASRRVTIFAAGTGNPFFTTDTTAALRAIEMGCQAMANATRSRRGRRWTVSTRPIPRRSRPPSATTGLRTERCWRAISRSWTAPPSRLPATTIFR